LPRFARQYRKNILRDFLSRTLTFHFPKRRRVNQIKMPPNNVGERVLIAVPCEIPQQFKIGLPLVHAFAHRLPPRTKNRNKFLKS
jgi:hypothetical protein